jgi:hypothetical protein
MSYIQLVARYENLCNAYDDTLAEIEARQYHGKTSVDSVLRCLPFPDSHYCMSFNVKLSF